MTHPLIAAKIIALKDADLALRDKLAQTGQLGEGYHADMKDLHNRNALILNDMIDAIGYPAIDKVGEEAHQAAWLVIQHSIGQPGFMKKCAALLEEAVRRHLADPKNLAYLTDRIAVLEGKQQRYGTQFDWDENGALSPVLIDAPSEVNERRKSIGLNTLEEQTEIIRRQAKAENQSPPADVEKRRQEADEWRKSVGWIRTIILLLAALCHFPAPAQTPFEKADSIAAAFAEPYENVEDLALKLTRTLSTDEEKARVFFMWIAHNIRYDCGKFHNPEKPEFRARTQEELLETVEAWIRSEIEKTAKYRKGVCADYSHLFKALCDATGLEAVVITGVARDFYKPQRNPFDLDHAWNAVRIKGEWRLLDATWGAGYSDAGVTKFYRRVSPGFFCTPPVLFAQNHFPEDESWQLLEKPLSKQEYTEQPLINYGQIEYRILDFATGAEVTTGEKNEKQIWLQFENTPKELIVSNRAGNSMKFRRTDAGGKVFLSFPASATGTITVFGGRSLRSRMEWMAKYEL